MSTERMVILEATLRFYDLCKAPIHRAIVPAKVLKRWDSIAAAQLFAASTGLVEEIDRLRSDVASADDLADHWHGEAMRLHEELGAATGSGLGLTQDGRLVTVPKS